MTEPSTQSLSSTASFHSVDWHHALYLPERIQLYKQAGLSPLPEPEEPALQQFEDWLEHVDMSQEEFDVVLTGYGIARNDFKHILSGHYTLTDENLAPFTDWLDTLEAIYNGTYADVELPDMRFKSPEDNREYSEIPFQTFFVPFMQYGLHKFDTTLERLLPQLEGWSIDVDAIRQHTIQQLATTLLTYGSRTLVLELNIARLREILQGDTAQERYHYFNQQILSQPEYYYNLLHEYAVLARLLVTVTDFWHQSLVELLERLQNDYHDLAEMFMDGDSSGNLTLLSGNLSHAHNEGRTVYRLAFNNGTQIIYKPKSLAMDEEFQNLLHHLNEMGADPHFPPMQVLNREEYGWTACIIPETCTTEAELERFYQRQGGYLALLYLLEATDFHSENLIAQGDSPFLIDLEALFHHHPPVTYPTTAHGLASRELEQSVLRTGLLPQWIWSSHDNSGVDISGIGGEEGQMTPRPVPILSYLYQDEMRVERKHYPMQIKEHRPTLNDQTVQTARYVPHVIDGFSRTYELLMTHKTQLMTILENFHDVTARQILRGTRTYSLLNQESQHPDHLRDGLQRNWLFDRLWLGVYEQGFMKEIVPSEVRDLLQGDIPIFTARPGQHHVWDSRGKQFADFFKETSLTRVKDRLQRLSRDDLQQQLHYLRGSMASIDRSADYTEGTVYQQSQFTGEIVSEKERFLHAAERIGEQLVSSAFTTDEDAGWIGLTLDNEDRWILQPVGIDMYNGVAGMALFLGYLGDKTNRDDFTAMARKALQPVRASLKIQDDNLKHGSGAFSGYAANFYVIHHLAQLWDEPALYDELWQALPVLEKEIRDDPCMDILSGVAGAAMILLDLYEATGKPALLELAELCGDRICEEAVPQDEGVGWYMFRVADPMAGFAHGVAGIVWALLRLHDVLGKDTYYETAMQGLTYERSLFIPAQGNWLDVRNVETMPTPELHIPTRWCHGAPGVVLGRRLSLPYVTGDAAETMMEEIEIGVQTMRINGFGGSHCLCHGDLGNADIMYITGQLPDKQSWQMQAKQFASYVLKTGQPDGNWICGLPQDAQTPGLMVGLAGIGFGLLRFWSPEEIPSVVSLDKPVK